MHPAPSSVPESDGWDDEMLLALLQEVFDEVDPVPEHVVAAARAVFGRRTVGS